MTLKRQDLTKSDIDRVYDLLKLVNDEGSGDFRGFGGQLSFTKRRRVTYGTWLSNRSQPITTGKVKSAQLERSDR